MSLSLQDEYIKKESMYGANNYAPLSVVLNKGEGAHLWDVDGNKYLDMVSAYSAVSHGHSHPELIKTIQEQSSKLAITSRAFYTEPFGNFLEQLTEISGFESILTMNTGAEAVELLLRLLEDGDISRKELKRIRLRLLLQMVIFMEEQQRLLVFPRTLHIKMALVLSRQDLRAQTIVDHATVNL